MIQVNEYFDGKVKSLKVSNVCGDATVGVIEPGTYEFGTSTKEIMHVVSGKMDVLLPGETTYVPYVIGESFEVEKGEKFSVQVAEPVAYLCYYV